MGELPCLGPEVGDEENQKSLQDERNRYQEDVQRVFYDGSTLEGENDDQGQ